MSQTKILVWGNNNQHLLSTAPNQCLTRPQQIIFHFQILKITATQKNISFITTNGDLYSYGSNTDGRLGIGAKDSFSCHYKNPVKVNLQSKAKQIKSGFSHICVQLQNNQIYAWGLGEYGSLGVGQFRSKYIPTRVLVPPTIRSISCGAMHSSFIDFDGNMFMCGSNEYGQLGVKNPDKIGTPILVPFSSRVKQVACGVFYTLVLTQTGDVFGMGNNKYAQLGLGHKINQNKPTLIHQLSNIVKIQAGYHSGALNSMCELYLWGCGSFGQYLRPKKIILNCPLSSLQIRGFFGIAISQSQNRVFIWGNNTHGQLGNGGYISYKTPTQMKDLSVRKINKICCGVNFALAIVDSDSRRYNYHHPRIQQGRRMSAQKRSPNYLQELSTGRKRLDFREQSGQQFRKTQQNSSHRTRPVYQPKDHSQSPINKATSRKRYVQQIQSPQRAADIQSSGRRRHQETSSHRSIHLNQLQRYGRDTTRSYSPHQRNYEDLFINLSKDYETLAKRYKELQSQIQQRQVRRSRDISATQNQLFNESQTAKQTQLLNSALKQQSWMLQKQLIKSKQELAISLQKIIGLEKEVQFLLPVKQQLSIALQKISLLQKQIDFLNKNKNQGPDKNMEKIIKLQKQVEKLNKQNEKIKKQYQKLDKENVKLEKENLKFEKEFNKMEKELSNYQKQIQQLNSKLREKGQLKSQGYVSPFKSPIKRIQNKNSHKELKSMEEKDHLIEKLEEQKKILADKLQEEKCYSAQIQTKYKLMMLKQSEKLKNPKAVDSSKLVQSPVKSYPNLSQVLQTSQQPPQPNIIDLKIIQDLKNIIIQKQQELRQVQHEKSQLKDLLQAQKLYAQQIQNKYKTIIEGTERTKLQNLNLRQNLLKSEDRISIFEGDLRKMVSEKEYQNVHKQLVQYKGKVKQFQQKHTKLQLAYKNLQKTITTLQDQRLKLYNMLQNMRNIEKQTQIINNKKVQQQKEKTLKCQQKIKQYQMQIKYEKQYNKKLQEKANQLNRMRQQTVNQLQRITQNLEKQKKRKKQLQRQVEAFKTIEHQLKITKEQLEKERELSQDYKDKVLKQYKKKDNLIKQIQHDLEQKQAELLQVVQKKQNDIQRLKQEIRKLNEKIDQQKQQIKRLNRQTNLKDQEIQNLKEELSKTQRKLKHTKDIMDKEVKQRQSLAEEVSGLKKEHTKLIMDKGQLQKRIFQLEKSLSESQNTIRRQRNKTVEAQNQVADLQQQLASLKQQNAYMRSQLDQANAAVEEANKISEQLSNANKQFSQNQENLNKKVEYLQARVYQLQDENRSYTPKYQALLERNKQLDQRNKQLSDMVNKAIQIQAQSYKQNILKQVQISTNQIINDVQDQKIYKQKYNRKPQKQPEYEHSEQEQHSYNQQPQMISRVKEEPYTKYMNEKIESHRRRVSQSAHKLADILDLESGIGSAYTKRNDSVSRRNNDQNYERINNHMENLKTQKQAFMSKINSFAQKMKLL